MPMVKTYIKVKMHKTDPCRMTIELDEATMSYLQRCSQYQERSVQSILREIIGIGLDGLDRSSDVLGLKY